MKIGVCVGTDIERLKTAKRFGFDFAESHCQNIVKMTDEELKAFKEEGIPVLAANCFIGMRIVGEERDIPAIKAYLNTLFERSAYLGIKCLVFGSSGARNIPEGGSYDETYEQIVYFLKELVAPLAEKYGITVAIEPLRKGETNIINTVPEAEKLAQREDSPYIRVLADVKHMVEGNDPLDNLPAYKGMLVHAHTSNPYPDPALGKKRTYPRPGDEFNQDDFILPVIAAGVEMCSIEADCIDFVPDCEGSIAVLAKYMDK
jgi:sugar phosphate isomerase/epimerase